MLGCGFQQKRSSICETKGFFYPNANSEGGDGKLRYKVVPPWCTTVVVPPHHNGCATMVHHRAAADNFSDNIHDIHSRWQADFFLNWLEFLSCCTGFLMDNNVFIVACGFYCKVMMEKTSIVRLQMLQPGGGTRVMACCCETCKFS